MIIQFQKFSPPWKIFLGLLGHIICSIAGRFILIYPWWILHVSRAIMRCSFLWLASFTEHSVFEVFSCCILHVPVAFCFIAELQYTLLWTIHFIFLFSWWAFGGLCLVFDCVTNKFMCKLLCVHFSLTFYLKMFHSTEGLR